MSKCQRHSARWHKYRRAKVKRKSKWNPKSAISNTRSAASLWKRRSGKAMKGDCARRCKKHRRRQATEREKPTKDQPMVTWTGCVHHVQSGTLWYRGGVGERSLYQSNLPEVWAQTQTQGAGLSLCKRSLRVCRASGCGGSLEHLVKTRPQPSRGYVPSVCSCPSPLRLSKNKTNQHKSIWRLCQ